MLGIAALICAILALILELAGLNGVIAFVLLAVAVILLCLGDVPAVSRRL